MKKKADQKATELIIAQKELISLKQKKEEEIKKYIELLEAEKRNVFKVIF